AYQKTHNLLGVELGELVGRKTRDFYADPLVYAEAISLLTKDERIERFEIKLQRHDGDRIWVIVSSAPINFEGQPAIFAGMLDITAHKQAEQELLESERRFCAIAESSPIPMLITRQNDGLILYANEHVEALLGYEEEGILGRKVEIFMRTRQRGKAARRRSEKRVVWIGRSWRCGVPTVVWYQQFIPFAPSNLTACRQSSMLSWISRSSRKTSWN
ncbi:MAG: PAS domain-containing protein, partial [Alphaproteobacteria bacterium]|nr:PAS domain-containing protein [Alphaproteobacteria bacterium]